jgi:hypothetical protein
MRRSQLKHLFHTLEPTEYANLRVTAPDLAFALTSAAITAIPAAHPDQGRACRIWLDTLMPADRDTGWLTRLAGLVIAARDRHAPINVLRPEVEQVWLLQAAYMLATDITAGARRPDWTALTVIQRNGITSGRTPRAALTDILTQLASRHPECTPSAYLLAALTSPRRRPAQPESPLQSRHHLADGASGAAGAARREGVSDERATPASRPPRLPNPCGLRPASL